MVKEVAPVAVELPPRLIAEAMELPPRMIAEAMGIDYDLLPEFFNSYSAAEAFGLRSRTRLDLAMRRGDLIASSVQIRPGGRRYWFCHKDDLLRYLFKRTRGPQPRHGVQHFKRGLVEALEIIQLKRADTSRTRRTRERRAS